MMISTIKENSMSNSFLEIKSEYLQNSYFKSHLGLIVSESNFIIIIITEY